MGSIQTQNQNGRLLFTLGHLGHTLDDFLSRGAHLRHPKALAHLSYHLMGGVAAQGEPGKLREQFLGRLERNLGGQAGPSFLNIPLLSASRQLQGFI